MVKMMKKIGILTFHWADDFGAMLQAYGLKKYLMDHGFDVTMIPYSNNNLEGRYRFLPKHIGYKYRKLFIGDYDIWEMLRNVKHFRTFVQKRSNMRAFRTKYLTKKRSISKLDKLNTDSFDVIIIGSDQVWNPELTLGLDDAYVGRFPLKENGKVISYAASFGKETLEAKIGEELGACLDRYFAAVSLREKSSIEFLQQYTAKNLIHVPDPTLLNPAEVWKEIIRENKHKKFADDKKGYIVYHGTEFNPNMIRYAELLEEKSGKIVRDVRKAPYGPAQFLDAMSEADYVVTNSFHGTVFSILLERQFVVFAHSEKNARLKDLLESLGLSDRLAETHELETIDRSIDWFEVKRNIIALRQNGEKFLSENLEE